MEQPHGYPMFIPGDFQTLSNDSGGDDLVPFHRWVSCGQHSALLPWTVSMLVPCSTCMVFISARTVL